MQVAVQNRVLRPVLVAQGASATPTVVPWPLKLMKRWPLLQALPAYVVGVGVRPEHVRSPCAGGRAVPPPSFTPGVRRP